MLLRAILGLLLLLMLTACQPELRSDGTPVTGLAPERLTEMRDQAAQRGRGLDVQPFRDAGVSALLNRADAAEQRGEWDQVALWLARAGEAADGADPLVLQRQAELALLMADFDDARLLALRSFELGPKTGPLCLRNFETVALEAELRSDSGAADLARQRQSVCFPERAPRL